MTVGVCERAAIAALAWLCSAAYGPSVAQAQAPRAPAGSADAPVAFDIPAQPMASALNSWAVQANAQLFVDPGPVAHLTAPAVKGTLPPRKALRALLAHSNLQVSQGAGGVFVIKPRVIVAARPAPPPPQPAPEPVAAPVAAAPPPLSARAAGGPWRVGLGATMAIDDGDASGGASLAARGEYLITDHLAAALALTTPRTHAFEAGGTALQPAHRASARIQSTQLSLKYFFTPEQRVDPYLGAGIDVTALYDANGVEGLDHSSVGALVEAGLEVRLAPHWLLDTDVSWEQVRADAASIPAQQIRLDPVRVGIGVAYQF